MALEELADQEGPLRGQAVIVDLHHVRMIEACQDASLALEASAPPREVPPSPTNAPVPAPVAHAAVVAPAAPADVVAVEPESAATEGPVPRVMARVVGDVGSLPLALTVCLGWEMGACNRE